MFENDEGVRYQQAVRWFTKVKLGGKDNIRGIYLIPVCKRYLCTCQVYAYKIYVT